MINKYTKKQLFNHYKPLSFDNGRRWMRYMNNHSNNRLQIIDRKISYKEVYNCKKIFKQSNGLKCYKKQKINYWYHKPKHTGNYFLFY